MTFTIIGYNTKKGNILKNRIIKIVNEMDSKVTINLEMSNAKNAPILYLNKKRISTNKVPTERELQKQIKNNL